MALSQDVIKNYTEILESEMKAAMGCTEPIAIAYCSAVAVKALGKKADRYEVGCSGNIIKNTLAVTVPQTGGQRGLEVAVLAGGIGGNADKELEVLSDITPEQIQEIKEAVAKKIVKVSLLDTTHQLHIIVDAYAGNDHTKACLADTHTGIYHIEKNGKVLLDKKLGESIKSEIDYSKLNIKDILEYANEVNLTTIRPLFEREIKYNMAISDEGLKNDWGAGVGKTIKANSADERSMLIARAAAGSDARMNGCALPVVINSGSGNQGITVSLPVIQYALNRNIGEDTMIRALVVSNLVAIRQKRDIGRLSAFCGAVSAATGSACGIAYLDHQPYSVIAQTIENSIVTVGGMVCDGAKSSCASKIATALSCALLGYDMAKVNLGFKSGEGIVKDNVEETITAVGEMAAKGMSGTDKEVLKIMLK